MKYGLRSIAWLCLALTAPAAVAEDWRLEKESAGIEVFTRAVDGSPHRAVKARMIVEVPVAELVALVRDTEACREWAQFCAESRIHETASETEAWIYTLNDMPWPVSDRDALTHVVWSVEPDSGAVRMDARATSGRMDDVRGRVRLTDATTLWRFLPLADGRVEVLSEAHVDPAGPVPAWITNRLLVEAPWETMDRMRSLVATGRWAGAEFAFLRPR